MLAPELQSLLQTLRSRIRRYVVLDSVLAIVAVLLGAFWIGLLVDYLPVTVGGSEMPRSARGMLLLVVGVIVLVIVIRMLLSRLRCPLPDDSLALLVERHHPKLGGRLVTAVQLNQPGRSGDSHSPELLQLVHREASQSIDEVDPGRVFRMQPLVRKAAFAGPLLLLALGFAIYSPSAFARAAARLTLFSDARWPRRARLEMVGVDLPSVTAQSTQDADPTRVEFTEGVMRLPIGSSGTLRIRAAADDAEVPSLCTVYYQTEDGTRGQSNMRRVGRERDGFQAFVLDGPPLSNLAASFSFSILGLDDRLPDFRIEAVEPPAITEMNVQIRYPNYLRESAVAGNSGEVDFATPYQAGLRISEGSRVTLEAIASLPLGAVDAVLEFDGQEQQVQNLSYSEDRTRVRLTLDHFRSPTAIRLVPADSDGISAQAPFRYFLGAILDEPPTVGLSLSGIQSAVTPIARLPVECLVQDDYGVESVKAFVARSEGEKKDGAANDESGKSDDLPPISKVMQPDRDGKSETVIDLRELTNTGQIKPLQPGGSISVYAESSDGFDLDGTHLTTSEMFRLQVVTAEELLTLMERRELGLRTRLEQTVTETQGLRDQLSRFRADRFEVSTESQDGESAEQTLRRQLQIIRLRVQQAGLQTSKAAEELTGIAESLDDLLLEMVNNRVDSKDRQERLGVGVRDPLRRIVDVSMKQLNQQIQSIEQSVADPEQALAQTELAIVTVDEVLLQLSAVLEKMLDLESYNELLDLVRGLIQDQNQIKEDTQTERKNRVKDLFK